MTNILALDLGSNLGYYDPNMGEAITISLDKGDERFLNFARLLANKLSDDIDIVIFEEAAFQQGNAIHLYHGLVGILKSYCLYRGKTYKAIPVGTIKKSFTGKGRWTLAELIDINIKNNLGLPKSKLTKAPIIAKIKELGIKYDTDNAADAYAVYYTYKELYEKK